VRVCRSSTTWYYRLGGGVRVESWDEGEGGPGLGGRGRASDSHTWKARWSEALMCLQLMKLVKRSYEWGGGGAGVGVSGCEGMHPVKTRTARKEGCST